MPSPDEFELAARPDPIPAILTRQRAGRVKLAVAAALAAGVTVFALDYADLPRGWLPLALGWICALIFIGSIYVKSLGREAYADSMLDLLLDRAWQMFKLLVAVNLAWSGMEWLRGGWAAGLYGFCQRSLGLPGLLMSGEPNFLQAACLAPWVKTLYRSFRSVGRARAFEAQLAPGVERRMAADLWQARRLGAMGQGARARALLLGVRERLAGLDGYAQDKGLVYHRELMRQKVELALGEPGIAMAPEASLGVYGAARAGGREAPQRDRHEELRGHDARPGPEGAGEACDAHMGYERYRDFFNSLRERSTVAWGEVAGLNEIVTEMKTVLALAMARTPSGVRLEPPKRILLYGPPGTGKTLITAALSNGFDAPFYNIKVSDVLSKFFGESTRLVSAIFELAVDQGPAVLFFDEIEAISGSREGGGTDGEERRMISALLAQLDGLKNKGQNIPLFTIAATNLPWKLDNAILSRFEKQFYIPLPGPEARRAILDLHLATRGFQVTAPLEKIIEASHGYSGRELARLCQEAIRLMLAEANPKLDQLADAGQGAMARYKLKLEPVNAQHFITAFKRVRPQTSPQLLQRYDSWRQHAR